LLDPLAPTVTRSRFRALFPQGLGGAELVLTTLVVLIVIMLVVPLPPLMLDFLLATNLSLSIVILLLVLYTSNALRISTFPTILLVTTLFRLGLNISSSRLILLHGNAGQVIKAFGGFVVQGNYVVGAAVFLILTIVQFVVIAKGAERVAEVGARFVLDAMPGKQMAIDAELRAGAISHDEARQQRQALLRESQFYGAMDGAMKFVKGDVIASVIITILNFLVGISLGIFQRNLAVDVALKKYGLLTVGDGLVTQIPALVLSIAAGMLVTRVASEHPGTSLGSELGKQLTATPRAMRGASLFVGLLAIIPGLPTIPFLAVAAMLFTVSWFAAKQQSDAKEEGLYSPLHTHRQLVPVVTPWSVDISTHLHIPHVSRADLMQAIASIADAVPEQIFNDLGVPIPTPVVRVVEDIKEPGIVVRMNEVPLERLDFEQALSLEQILHQIRTVMMAVMKKRAVEFLGLQETQSMLDRLEQVNPAVVRHLVPKVIRVPTLQAVLRKLVEEQLPIRNLSGILEELARWVDTEKNASELAERVRASMKRTITYRLTEGRSQLDVVLIDTLIEDEIRQSIMSNQSGRFLSLPPGIVRDILSAMKETLDQAPSTQQTNIKVLLTQPEIRRFVRQLIAEDCPDVWVVSHAELDAEVHIHPVATVKLSLVLAKLLSTTHSNLWLYHSGLHQEIFGFLFQNGMYFLCNKS
jgi:type III secretion protein V